MRSGDIVEGLEEDHPLPQALAVFAGKLLTLATRACWEPNADAPGPHDQYALSNGCT